MKDAKRTDLESSYKKKHFQLCMVMDVNQTYDGDHFSKYTNRESICYMPETVNYTSIEIDRKGGRKREGNNDREKDKVSIQSIKTRRGKKTHKKYSNWCPKTPNNTHTILLMW